jgi:hypothetical protein
MPGDRPRAVAGSRTDGQIRRKQLEASVDRKVKEAKHSADETRKDDDRKQGA